MATARFRCGSNVVGQLWARTSFGEGPSAARQRATLVCGHAGYVTFDALGERRSNLALRIEEPDQDRTPAASTL